ncbi:MAG: hypothetical protein ACXIU2_12485, partial [Cyclobacteriaceae bacterium]
ASPDLRDRLGVNIYCHEGAKTPRMLHLVILNEVKNPCLPIMNRPLLRRGDKEKPLPYSNPSCVFCLAS